MEARSFLSFNDMMLLYQRCLRLIGILPFDGRDLTSCLASRIALVYSLTSGFVVWSMFLVYIVNAKSGRTIDTICETTMAIGASARYYLLIWRRSELIGLFEECRGIWDQCDEGGRRAVRRFERKIRLLFLFLLGSTIIVNVTYLASAVMMTLDATKTTSHNETPARYLPYKWYVEDGANLWPGYNINFAVQVLAMPNVGLIITSVDSAGPLLIMIAAGYFDALRQRFLRISEIKCDESVNVVSEFVACIRLHQRILNFCSEIDEITRILFFSQLLSCCYNLSLLGIKLIGSDSDRYKYVPVLLVNVSQLFICQWAPDHLIDESLAISTAAYSTCLSWTRARLGKLVVLVIARSQRPVQMTAASLVDLSLENFRSMVTSAVSFFTVLRNFNV